MTADDRHPELRTATLDEIAGRALPGAETVTAVIQQTVRREAVAAYEQWLKKVVPIAARFPGHRGVNEGLAALRTAWTMAATDGREKTPTTR